MERLKGIGHRIIEEVPQILEAWERLPKEEPWYSLPREYLLDHLPEVIRRVVHAALIEPGSREALKKVVEGGAENGRHRLDVGFPDTVLFTEYHLLRIALWEHLRNYYASDANQTEAILRIESVSTVAMMAALRGYHREVFESRDEWPETLEGLTDEWHDTLQRRFHE